MSKAKDSQRWLIIAAIILVALVYLSPKIQAPKLKENQPALRSFNHVDYIAQVRSKLPANRAEFISSIQSNSVDSISLLGKAWDQLQLPDVSSYYYLKIAESNPNELNCLNAAFRFFDGFRMVDDSIAKSYMISQAIANYEKVLQFNPGNLNAKTDLGICYAEGTNDPMKGIGMLREVVQIDSTHENAHFNLGILSMKSGQYEKAILRFKKVLTLNPKRIEMKLMIGNAYAQAGINDSALIILNEVVSQSTNATLVSEAKNIINNIK
ncbi:MAG: hypothetical protein RIQ89_1171 [Bacteroidota bacterium]|jgi:tetratricopeptide (TPR) repeat protein